MVSTEAAAGWLVILWAVYLVWANTTILGKLAGGGRKVTRAVRRPFDRERTKDLGAFFVGLFFGPMMVGALGGLLAGVSLGVAFTTRQVLIALTAALVVGILAAELRGD